MRVGGIVAEYNPFHNGHAWLIEQMRDIRGGRATHIVAVMSGNFVQRGEPALLPKEERVAMALQNGVDVVLELPIPYVLSSAEGFANGAIGILYALGCVDMLGFGSECGDAAALCEVAEWLDRPELTARMQFFMEGGQSYAQARQQALRELAGSRAAVLDGANNTLGVEYCRALTRLHSNMEVYTVPRLGVAHDAVAPSGSMASASLLRTLMAEGRLRGMAPYMPISAYDRLAAAARDGIAPADPTRVERALLYRLRQMDISELAALPAISEGLENRLYRAARTAQTVDEWLESVKTRRYPATRIRRLLWAAYTGLTDADRLAVPPYLRVLGMTARGEEVLSAAKRAGVYHAQGQVLLTRPTQTAAMSEAVQRMFACECRADDVYELTLPHPRPCGQDYTMGMIQDN